MWVPLATVVRQYPGGGRAMNTRLKASQPADKNVGVTSCPPKIRVAGPTRARHIAPDFGGEMAEWFKAHAWKACVGNTTVSSNLTLSASLFLGVNFPTVSRLSFVGCAGVNEETAGRLARRW